MAPRGGPCAGLVRKPARLSPGSAHFSAAPSHIYEGPEWDPRCWLHGSIPRSPGSTRPPVLSTTTPRGPPPPSFPARSRRLVISGRDPRCPFSSIPWRFRGRAPTPPGRCGRRPSVPLASGHGFVVQGNACGAGGPSRSRHCRPSPPRRPPARRRARFAYLFLYLYLFIYLRFIY